MGLPLLLREILPALLTRLRGDEDAFLSTTTGTLANARRIDQTLAGVEDVGNRVVRLQPAIEMLRDDLGTGTTRTEPGRCRRSIRAWTPRSWLITRRPSEPVSNLVSWELKVVCLRKRTIVSFGFG